MKDCEYRGTSHCHSTNQGAPECLDGGFYGGQKLAGCYKNAEKRKLITRRHGKNIQALFGKTSGICPCLRRKNKSA
jgi:hypothetical protein